MGKGTFPSEVDALERDEPPGQTNAFFVDAPTGEILANRARAIPEAPFKGPNYFAIQTMVADAISRVEVDQTDDPESSWNKAIQSFSELFG